jgi:hypothetical protein
MSPQSRAQPSTTTFPTIPPDADWGPAFAPTMIVRRRGGEEVAVAWPPDWPRPSAGNLIRVNGESLRVLEVTYDLDRSSLVLDCQ